jgi:hypothetical protein
MGLMGPRPIVGPSTAIRSDVEAEADGLGPDTAGEAEVVSASAPGPSAGAASRPGNATVAANRLGLVQSIGSDAGRARVKLVHERPP